MLASEKYPVGSRVIMVDDWWNPTFSRECYIGKRGVIESIGKGIRPEEDDTFYIQFADGVQGLTCTENYFRPLPLLDSIPQNRQQLPNI